MKHSNALLDNLTRSSSRLSKGIMVLLGVAVLLVSTTYWSFQRLIEEHHDTVRFHFTRLMQNIQEQELFLTSLRQRSLRGELMPAMQPRCPGSSRVNGKAMACTVVRRILLDAVQCQARHSCRGH